MEEEAEDGHWSSSVNTGIQTAYTLESLRDDPHWITTHIMHISENEKPDPASAGFSSAQRSLCCHQRTRKISSRSSLAFYVQAITPAHPYMNRYGIISDYVLIVSPKDRGCRSRIHSY
jgi:hypothetical protein